MSCDLALNLMLIRVLRKIPGFSGDTFLEIFVRMKLHCKKIGEDELANEVNQVIANLQNLAKYGLVSPKDGFNSFLKVSNRPFFCVFFQLCYLQLTCKDRFLFVLFEKTLNILFIFRIFHLKFNKDIREDKST